MASNSKHQSDRNKANEGSNTFQNFRVVAKIRGFSSPEAEIPGDSTRMSEWISVKKAQRESSESVAISFGEQTSSRKESYLVDYCYDHNEDNEVIYSKEVKPLVSAVLEGHYSTVIAYGARGSGKTHIIQGSAEKPGLATLVIAEFLSVAEQNGKSIAVSFYEVDHLEHALDLLNPAQPEIMVYEDRGRIQFKELSHIPVKSISDFQKLYFTANAPRKGAVKKGNERDRRSHMGLIVHVFSHNGSTESDYVGKLNIVDLAGYEDARRKSTDCSSIVETNKINKSIYSLLKVCHALTINESRVPYRESKITRMLQDSLNRSSKILMIACLNRYFCQDTIYMVSLIPKSCQGIHQASLDSRKKSVNLHDSTKSQLGKSASTTTTKKLAGSKSNIYEKKPSGAMKSAMKGRKLFDDARPSAKVEKARPLSNTGSTFETSGQDQENSTAPVTKESVPLSLDSSLPDAGNHVESNPIVEMDNAFSKSQNCVKPTPMLENDDSFLDARNRGELYDMMEKDASVDNEDCQEENTPNTGNYPEAFSIVQEGSMNKKNINLLANEKGSPPISVQLRELSNSLKSLFASTPLCVKIPEKEQIALDNQVSIDVAEPKTPVIGQSARLYDRWDVTNVNSPWETLSMHNSGIKDSFNQEYLRFFNTASKEDLMKLKWIGEKRATHIVELRKESPKPFKSLDDLKAIGLSAKQIKDLIKKEAERLFA